MICIAETQIVGHFVNIGWERNQMLNFARVSVEFRVAEVYVQKIQLIANISQQTYVINFQEH